VQVLIIVQYLGGRFLLSLRAPERCVAISCTSQWIASGLSFLAMTQTDYCNMPGDAMV